MMRVLIDTHIIIYRELNQVPSKKISGLFKILYTLNCEIIIHPLSLEALKRNKDIPGKDVLVSKVSLYPEVDYPPNPNGDSKFIKIVGAPKCFEDNFDINLLYCIYKNEADFLITDDEDIKEKADLLFIADKVLSLNDALAFFREEIKKKALTLGKAKSPLPKLSFFKRGTSWHIGYQGSEVEFKEGRRKGYKFIYLLLKRYHENKANPEIPVGELYGTEDISDYARNSAQKIIKFTILAVIKKVPDMKKYLNNITIETGGLCKYKPDQFTATPLWKLNE
ncbi:MAG: hypothetical protein WCQ99_03440 [Pseudomonadota bacterium]